MEGHGIRKLILKDVYHKEMDVPMISPNVHRIDY